MAMRSTFSPGGNGMTSGGLDRYLGPSALGGSSLPPVFEDATDPHAEPEVPVDCKGKDKDQAVCEIAKEEAKHEH